VRFLAAAFLLAVVALLGAPNTAQAQDEASEPVVEPREPPDLPPGDDVITALTEGARAPYTGMLLDTDTAIRWTNRLNWFRNELRLVMQTDAKILAAVRRSHETELRLVRESYEREIEGLRNDLRHQAETFAQAQARGHPWYDTFVFGVIIGVVFSCVLVGLTAWAAS
jgi:tetrahydromethanopterin S-methyltransferase subunit F